MEWKNLFRLRRNLNSTMYVEIMDVIYDKQWLGRSGMSLANEHLIGKMVAVSYITRKGAFFKAQMRMKEYYYLITYIRRYLIILQEHQQQLPVV